MSDICIALVAIGLVAAARAQDGASATSSPSSPATHTATRTSGATATFAIEVSKDDQLAHLRLINSARAIENSIHRLKLEYEAKRAELEASQRGKLDEYGKFITAKRLEYKVSTTAEIDIDKGVWVDPKPAPAK